LRTPRVPATPAIHTLSLHDALPICDAGDRALDRLSGADGREEGMAADAAADKECRRVAGDDREDREQRPYEAIGLRRVQEQVERSEEHTSELQSLRHLVCRLLLEKK